MRTRTPSGKSVLADAVLGINRVEIHRARRVRHRLVNRQLPIRPTGRQRLVQLDLASRFAILSRSELVSDRAVVRDKQR